MSTRSRVLAGLCAVLALTAGCSKDNSSQLPDNAKSAFGKQEKSGSKEAAAAAVTTLAGHYVDLSSRLDNDVARPVDDAKAVATDPALTTIHNDVMVRRARGIVTTGDIVLVSAKVLDLRIDTKPARAAVAVCVDTSNRKSRFPDGASANSPKRIDRGQMTLTMENSAWPADNGWRVTVDSSLRDRTRDKCTG